MQPPNSAPVPDQSKKVRPLAVALLAEIQSGNQDPKELSTEKKMLCVHFLIQQQSYSVPEMAMIMQVDRSTIYNYKKKLYQDAALAQLIVDEAQIALEMLETADHAAAKLIAQKKFKDAWTVRRECVQLMQSMGYVKKVEEKLNVKGSIDILAILNAEFKMREDQEQAEESPGHGDENGNGHAGDPGTDMESGNRMESVPE